METASGRGRQDRWSQRYLRWVAHQAKPIRRTSSRARQRGVHSLPASLLRTQKATKTITTRTISHKNTKELVPWGDLYPAATHSGGGETPTLNRTSKWAPPAVRIT